MANGPLLGGTFGATAFGFGSLALGVKEAAI